MNVIVGVNDADFTQLRLQVKLTLHVIISHPVKIEVRHIH